LKPSLHTTISQSMNQRSTHSWQLLKGYPAGKRFELFFNHRRSLGSSFIRRFFTFGGGIFLIIAGFVFLPTPVPGILLLFFGASLLAQESLFAARFLDWAEIRMRQYVGKSSSFWEKAHISLKVLITVSLICLLGLVGLRAYLLIFAM